MGEIIKEAGGNSAKNASKEAANKPTLRERINDLAKKNDSKIPILGPIWNGLRRIGWGVKLLTARFSDTSRRDALKRKYHSDESKVKETEEKAKERKEIKEIVSKLEKQSNLKKAHKSNEYNELKKDNKGKFRSSLTVFALCSLFAFGAFVTGGLIPVLLGAGCCIAGVVTAIKGIKNNNKYKKDKSALEERHGVKNEEDLYSLAKTQQKLIELEANLEYNETIRGNKDNKELKEKIENLKYNVKQLNKRCERSFEAVDTNLIDKGYKEIKEKIMNFNNIEGKEGKEMVGQDGKSKTAPEAPRQSHVERITEERNSSINSQVRAER